MSAQPTSVSHLNFETWVECDGKALPVYGVEINGTKATCWIASQAGKNFSVQFKMCDRSKRGTFSGYVYVDGTFVIGKVLGTVPPYNHSKCVVDEFRPTPTTKQSLCFSSLKTNDDDAIDDNELLSRIGAIRVEIFRVEVTGYEKRRPKEIPSHMGAQQLTVHEAAKKLGGHRVMLGAPEVTSAGNILRTEKIGSAIVEFEFKYRPQDVLEAQDIIPVTRAQVVAPQAAAEDPARKRPLEPNDTTNTNTERRDKKAKTEPVDVDALVAARARIRELEAQLDVKSGVKTEEIRVSGAFGPGQVIDLTDD
ncbi:hypothetical protein EXIGLDRAFT_775718 [Exidia glandulosa HHB12029]|uniref:DUF7918 domain-containing protein n=1 Tax=Exidia glandulosa HHB12029 TaxID=1314781 RepID=A0A165DSY8_EXIGL|nr:hypothetical protein EXIGLDRAFT_775718 [Exidia glandulosa HHB12029]